MPEVQPTQTTEWTLESLYIHLNILVDKLAAVQDERDRRYDQRFDGQQQAIKDALASAEKAVTAALIAADRAVAKAEAASEKRFEGVNEFRQTLSDQATRLMPRTEAEARFSALDARMIERFNALDVRLVEVSRFMERQHGAREGNKDSMAFVGWGLGLVATLIAIATAVAAFAR